ncbi:DUF2249 domain-containing protein [Pelagicoccus sp. NFK12]|uniref:DUF2249 domain-containing protein n=1 Tax=Pelagicoccus enzymogenes TaxID=2773457 RepID=A0A927IHJ7_9BACT|nr:DUF2249 domain-containing protein [Pelagicoccus enzymogenes]MBD5779773.1 DUF2249 domain-containing protein [Pelagicoccus enzymogenes]
MTQKTTTLDLREIVCDQRHCLVFQRLSVLEPGDWIILVNDHHPGPLGQQLHSKYGDRLSWSLGKVTENEFQGNLQLS